MSLNGPTSGVVVGNKWQIGLVATSPSRNFVEANVRDVNKPDFLGHFTDCRTFDMEFQVQLLPSQLSDVPEDHGVMLSVKMVKREKEDLPPDGSWIKARICHLLSSSPIEYDWRLVKVTMREADGQNNEEGPDEHQKALISPQLFFNMTNKEPILFEDADGQDRITFEVDSDTEPFYSTELTDEDYISCLTVSLISSPNYNGQDDYSSLLTWYFSTPRYLMKDDVIRIRKDDHCCGTPLYVYFKVVRVEGPGFWVDNRRSRLIQVSSVQSFIPTEVSFLSQPSSHSFIDVDRNVYHEVMSILQVYLKKLFPPPPSFVICGPTSCGKTSLVRKIAQNLSIHLVPLDFNLIIMDTPATTEAKIRQAFEKGVIHRPCLLLLENFDLLLLEGKGNDERYAQVVQECFNKLTADEGDDKKNNQYSIPTHLTIVMTTLTDHNLLWKSEAFADVFRHIVSFSSDLGEKERVDVLTNITRNLKLSPDINIKTLAKKTHGFSAGDLIVLTSKATHNSYKRTVKNDSADGMIKHEDFSSSLEEMTKRSKKALGVPEIPSVRWDDVGGLEDVKKEIVETIQLPLQFPQLFSKGLKRGGILLHGPPGTGKTLLAKAVATEVGINFYSVKGPELINMYVGQSEQNVRDVFARGRSSSPCVIFFDELDSLAPNRGRSGDSGGVMDRVVSQLLAEMDGLSKSNGLFVIGATNRVDLLDPALLRPGRFDKIIHVGISTQPSARLKILKALTRKFKMAEDVKLEDIESKCPKNFSGADFYSLCSSAMNQSLARSIHLIEEGKVKEEEADIILEHKDFLDALIDVSRGIGNEVSETPW